jgi:hypothetical protein
MADENLVDEVVDTKVVTPDPVSTVDDSAADTGLLTDPVKDPVADVAATKPGDWPADWRDKFAGGDAAKAARLSRYTSPQALTDALIAAQNKIRTGDLKPVLGKDAKPEEIAAFRESHGIPEAPDKYDLGDLEVPEGEKPLVSKFLASAHTVNMTPEQVRASLSAYTEISEAARNDRLTQDNEIKSSAEDTLRAEWGTEYRTNINLITNFLDAGPEGLREKLLRGRLADGTPIGSSTEALKFLAGLAREKNPAGVVVPSGVASAQSVADEIQKIEKTMRDDRAAYNRDDKLQARYRQLLEWRIAQGSQQAA